MSRKATKHNSVEELLKELLIPEDEQPYEIPENWVWVKLESITKKITDGAHKTPVYIEEGIPFISVKDIKDHKVSFEGTRFISIDTHKELVKRCDPEFDDILITKSGTIGRTAIIKTDREFSLFVSVALVKTNKHITNPKFLELNIYHGIKLLAGQKFIKGSSIKNLHLNELKKFHIPLPPVSEQKRIADKVERLLNKIDEAKQLIDEARETFELRRAAILDKAFRGKFTMKWREENPGLETGELLLKRINEKRMNATNKKQKIPPIEVNEMPYELPQGWKWARFDEIAIVESNLVSPMDFEEYPHIAPDNIERKTGRLLEYRTIFEDGVKSPKHHFHPNQIIYSKIRPYLSKLIIAEFEGLCSADMYPIRSEIHNQYLFYYMLSSFFVESASTAGSRSVLPKINQKELGRILIPVPPIEEQKVISNMIARFININTEGLINLEMLDEKTDMTKQSILSKAFRGELGTNDPKAESGVELLKEVIQEQLK